MAVVLDADLWDVFSAASSDNSDARWATEAEKNIPSTKNELAISDTNKSTETANASEKEPCEPCQKSFKVKVQEAVTSALKALGIEKVEQTVKISQEISMDKKAKVEAMIASDKTRFEHSASGLWVLATNSLL